MWWTRHKKAPAIIPENSEAAETDPEQNEKDLVEAAASEDKEEAGRALSVHKHTQVPGRAQPGSHKHPQSS